MMTTKEFENYFSKNNNLVISKDNVQIKKRGDFYMIDYLLEEIEGDRYEKYVLHEESMGLEAFFKIYGIASFEDLEMLSGEKLWAHYLAGDAAVVFTNAAGAELNFMVVEGKTKVYSYHLKYDGEVDRVFDKVKDFKNWVDEHWEMIERGVIRNGYNER